MKKLYATVNHFCVIFTVVILLNNAAGVWKLALFAAFMLAAYFLVEELYDKLNEPPFWIYHLMSVTAYCTVNFLACGFLFRWFNPFSLDMLHNTMITVLVYVCFVGYYSLKNRLLANKINDSLK